MNNLINLANEIRAQRFATNAHDGQTRKYTGEAYISHPSALIYLLETVNHTSEMIQAAWLHDVVEDTDISIEEIFDEFGPNVGRIVHDLTEVKTEGNRKTRKEAELVRLSKIGVDSQTVKLCDLIDNSRSIIACDPLFAKVYVREKRNILHNALKQGDSKLWQIADKIVTDFLKEGK